MNMEEMMSLCESKTLAEYISPGGKVSNMTRAAQEVLCINTDMLQMILDDQTQQKQFEDEVNWTRSTGFLIVLKVVIINLK